MREGRADKEKMEARQGEVFERRRRNEKEERGGGERNIGGEERQYQFCDICLVPASPSEGSSHYRKKLQCQLLLD